ncbi:spondin domain-containing protein [Fulvivirga sedimenti]|uniref:Spondin domain-containing protein n=1 Tax=Fulvivirga sedimenti TaxID=2879465 RepID=A0A9X1KZQ4_9BACT|nr:spondin domain-containing protein [Fulvivirga sedimenti]MCA6078560.1 spondin domain-containing protein [Fulvivirga sedimenti]
MKKIINSPVLMAIVIMFVLASCNDDDDDGTPVSNPVTFEVTIENINPALPFYQSGIFNTPDGAAAPGPVLPGSGDTYTFTFNAGSNYVPGAVPRLSFLTMLVASNDLFLAPGENGIPLFDSNGDPLNGDITDEIYLWDAGTEVNRMPGSPDQPGPSSDPAGSGTDENGLVTLLGGTGSEISVEITTESGTGNYIYPPVDELVRVTISNTGTVFTVTLENLSGSSNVPSPLSPGGFAIHIGDQILFAEGEAERGNGIEEIAEDGITTVFADYVGDNNGLIVPLSPGVFAVHDAGILPLFEDGQNDYGDGLEAIAEDGDPSALTTVLASVPGVTESGAFGSAPIGPGGSYQFTFTARPGDYLSWATMFVQSNDWIYTFDEEGVSLFNGNTPASGDLTSLVKLYDTGTETDQYPGAGEDQAIRQPAADTGAPDANVLVREITSPGDIIPATNETIRVTIRVVN